MPYIEATKDEDRRVAFEDLPGLGDDRAALIIHRSEMSFLMLNKFPYNAGHLMALPYRAVPELTDLSADERADLMECIVTGQEILREAFNPDGFNVGFNFGQAGGAGIPKHLHCHIVPRWKGDTNFMPVIGETRVLPESLDRIWERLSGLASTRAR